jgi:hypothetical protein
MKVNCPSVYVGAIFRPTSPLPNKAGDNAPTQDKLIQEGAAFTVTSVEDIGDSTRVTLSRQVTYGVETLLRGFSTVV